MRRAGGRDEERRYDEPHVGMEDEAMQKRPRLKLTYLYEMIEALREDHRKLAARVDELSRMLDAAESLGAAQAAAASLAAELPAARGGGGGADSAAELDRTPEGDAGTDASSEEAGRQTGGAVTLRTASGHRYVWRIEEAAPSARPMRAGSDAARIAAGGAPPGVRFQAAADAGEGRAPDGFHAAAIWAGVEQAIGNAAAALTAETAAASAAASAALPTANGWAVAERPAAGARAPVDGESGAPDESLLLELREAARIADEIANHASVEAEVVPAPALRKLPARTEGGAGADAAAPVRRNEAAPPAETSAGGTQRAAAAAVDAKRLSAHMPEIYPVLASRAERHQAYKKRSFWSRLFTRQA